VTLRRACADADHPAALSIPRRTRASTAPDISRERRSSKRFGTIWQILLGSSYALLQAYRQKLEEESARDRAGLGVEPFGAWGSRYRCGSAGRPTACHHKFGLVRRLRAIAFGKPILQTSPGD
jgi:hypothetical protein